MIVDVHTHTPQFKDPVPAEQMVMNRHAYPLLMDEIAMRYPDLTFQTRSQRQSSTVTRYPFSD
jgi:hypothetical protein